MIDLAWKDHLPEESLAGGLRLLEHLRWHLVWGKTKQGLWVVKAGHCVLFRASNREAVEAFLYGMALAYSVMPDSMQSAYRRYVLREEGNPEEG